MQTPDTKPGAYYVSAVDAGRTVLLFGPYLNNHAGALAAVDRVRNGPQGALVRFRDRQAIRPQHVSGRLAEQS